MSLRDIDLSYGPTPDAESIVCHLLMEFASLPAWEGTRVQSEVTPVTDSTLPDHPVILYQCGSPALDGDTGAWFWRVPLTLTVLVWEDPQFAWRLASSLDMAVRLWPEHAPTPYGRVCGVPAGTGFARQQIGNIVTAKAVTQYGCDKTLVVAPPPDWLE